VRRNAVASSATISHPADSQNSEAAIEPPFLAVFAAPVPVALCAASAIA
jgi:hypothetical protein